MPLTDELRKIWLITQLSEKAMADVGKRKEATLYAIAFFVLTSAVSVILIQFSPDYIEFPLGNTFFLLLAPLISLLAQLAIAAVIHVCALLFKGNGSILSLFRVFGYFSFVGIVGILPGVISFLDPMGWMTIILSGIISVYVLTLNVYAIKAVENITLGKAVLTLVIPLVVFSLFGILVLFFALTTLPPLPQ